VKPFKIPESVLVVVHDPSMQVLLLERADRPGFWQSVTGSLDSSVEPRMNAAKRELAEETGLKVEPSAWHDWQFRQEFEIFPHWRHRYAPGVSVNTEHLFSVEVPRDAEIRLSAREHLQFRWLDWQAAADACFSWTNSAAIRKIAASRGLTAASTSPES
jgi:dATP pyrophosphohydrolase